MRIRLGRLRALIKEALVLENPAGASGSDPTTEPKGFYDYDYDIGTDQWIAGPDAGPSWYRAPGKQPGSEGDPFRPEDAQVYLGQKAPPDNSVATPAGAEGEEGTAAREIPIAPGAEPSAEVGEEPRDSGGGEKLSPADLL